MSDSKNLQDIWSVHQLTKYIKNRFEQDPKLRDVWLRGEISNYKHHSSGHMYFTLKDADSKITAVMFAGHNRFLRFTPKEGLKVILRAEVSVFERDGQYQLYVKEMQPDGIGNLYLEYEQLKARLQTEGLFLQKRALPSFPKVIALLTSETGAVIRDMITTLNRRYPLAQLLVIPVLVQGERAPVSIVNGMKLANSIEGIDVIIFGRGGGSIEELWAFNDETVARAIFNSGIPTISAVGHETDFTIADFVADQRAATPTAAAEIATPHFRELLQFIDEKTRRLENAIWSQLKQQKNYVNQLKKSVQLRKPTNRVNQMIQQLDYLNDRLLKVMQNDIKVKRTQLDFYIKRLQLTEITVMMVEKKGRLTVCINNLQKTFIKIHEQKKHAIMLQIQKLEALNPLSILKRGYSVAMNEKKVIISSAKQISPGELIYVQFKDGVAQSTVWGIDEEVSLWNKRK